MLSIYRNLDCGKNLVLFYVLVVAIMSVNAVAQQIVNTIAGTGTAGCSGFNGRATSAEFNVPAGIAIDSLGYIYIAEYTNNMVRRISAIDTTITLLAGNTAGTSGTTGDNGQATSALFSAPVHLFLSTSNMLHVADSKNRIVRAITLSSGIITRLAGSGEAAGSPQGDGGFATSGIFSTIYGVWSNTAGDTYISDVGFESVRKVTRSTQILSRIAGSGAGVAGVSDSGVAATSTLLRDPCGLWGNSQNSFLHIAVASNHIIARITLSAGTISRVAGVAAVPGSEGDSGAALSATIFKPHGMYGDTDGNLYFSEEGPDGSVIRSISAVDSIINRVAGQYGIVSSTGDLGSVISSTVNNPRQLTG
jgi:hypothetical protein